jgi:hypothetical protein
MLQELVSDLNLVIKTMMFMAEEFGLEPEQAKTLVTAILNLVDRASYKTMMFMALESGLKPNQAKSFLDACITQMHEYSDLDIPADVFQGFGYRKTVYPRPKSQKKAEGSVNVEQIRELAYLKWEQAGRPSGRDTEFWLAAEKELREKLL